MTKFNFKSQPCTSREQSERLLALGLKKETADCYYWQENDHVYGRATGVWHLETLDTEDTQEHFEYLDKYFGVCLADDEEHYFIPAWSLHRLIEMIKDGAIRKDGTDEDLSLDISGDGLYDGTIKAIEWLIKEGYFNKEYLV